MPGPYAKCTLHSVRNFQAFHPGPGSSTSLLAPALCRGPQQISLWWTDRQASAGRRTRDVVSDWAQSTCPHIPFLPLVGQGASSR